MKLKFVLSVNLCYAVAMENTTCETCHKPKATLTCGLCHEAVCKKCALFMDDEPFSFLGKVPEDLSHSVYCRLCFDSKVAGELENYQETMKKAKNITVYLSHQGKETRLLRRDEDPIEIKDCLDENETLLRLAFLAAKANFTAIIDVELTYEKVRNGSFRHLKWSGRGIPTHIDKNRLNK